MSGLRVATAKDVRSILGAVQRCNVSRLSDILAERKLYGHDDLAKALQLAAEKGHDECVRLLLEYNAMPNIHDSTGFTPLIVAAKMGHAGIVKMLIEAGSKLDKATHRIRATALHWASTNDEYSCVEELVKAGANVEANTIHGQTAMMLAARAGNSDIVDLLIENGANVNTYNREGATPLHMAAEEGCEECVQALIKAGAQLNTQTKIGDTPLLKAAARGHADVIQILLAEGADLSRCRYELSALHLAAQGGHIDAIKVLLSAGLSVNVSTHDSYYGSDMVMNMGVTPLMLAAKLGHADTVQYLIDHGAKTDLVESEGKSALLYAIKSDNPECVIRLLDNGANPDGVVQITGNVTEIQGLSPLFVVLKDNNLTILKILLRSNCSLNVMGAVKSGCQLMGPLEYALVQGHVKAGRMLLTAGVNPWMINPEALDEIVAWLLERNESTCVLLMEVMRTPSSLMNASRLAIRHALGNQVRKVLSSQHMPLPHKLIHYLTLPELDD